MISVRGLTKRYGDISAVDDMTVASSRIILAAWAAAALRAGGWRLLRSDADR
ncbi:hypothetical protein [Nocardioides sp. LHG3406-4]|uniref:hypothetical protein n=1 Tax=Nocardioides sp. LHG3406-4 TaxID=2804575 RepID=UPI003CFB564F